MRKGRLNMTLTMEQFNEQVKVIDLNLVSLKESWDNLSKNKYQVKFGDIFRTINEMGEYEYYLYYNLMEAYCITSLIKEYIEKEGILNIDEVDLDFINKVEDDYYYFEEERFFFDDTKDSEGLFVPQGVEGFKKLSQDLVRVELVYIHDETIKDSFIEEWKNKAIVTWYGDDKFNSWGKLGDKTSVDGIFVGDIFKMFDPNKDEVEEVFTVLEGEDGEYILSAHLCYDVSLIVAYEDREYFKMEKIQSYKNFTNCDMIWLSDGFDLVELSE